MYKTKMQITHAVFLQDKYRDIRPYQSKSQIINISINILYIQPY